MPKFFRHLIDCYICAITSEPDCVRKPVNSRIETSVMAQAIAFLSLKQERSVIHRGKIFLSVNTPQKKCLWNFILSYFYFSSHKIIDGIKT
jgi:hypothetical protein